VISKLEFCRTQFCAQVSESEMCRRQDILKIGIGPIGLDRLGREEQEYPNARVNVVSSLKTNRWIVVRSRSGPYLAPSIGVLSLNITISNKR